MKIIFTFILRCLMPANNQMNPISLSKFNRILTDQTTENDQTNLFIFNKVSILLTQLPACLKETSTSDQLPCISNAEDPIKKQNDYWKNLIKKDQLKNIFNYLKIVIAKSNVKINEHSDRVNNLLTVCSRFLSTNLFSSEFINIDKDATAKAYLQLLIQITTLPEILNIHAKDDNLKFCELLNSTNQFLQDWARFNQNSSNSNFDVLKNYVEAIGNLTREFNIENYRSSLATFETPMTELINVLDPYLTTDQKSDLRYTFVHQYDSGCELINCEKVFNSTDCNSNYVSTEISHIDQGTVLESSDMSLEHNLDIGNRILKTLNPLAHYEKLDERITKTANLDNFSDYFKDLIKKANNENKNLEPQFIENLSKFLFKLTGVFQRTNPQSKFYRSSFSLLLTLLKNPAIEHNLLHIPKAIEAAADQMKILLNDGLKNSTRNPISRIFSTMDVLDDIFHQANDIVTMPAYEKLNIAKKIEEISFICLKLDNCSAFLNQFLKTLGALNRNLVKSNTTEKEVTAIQTIAQKIVTQAQHNVTQAEYEGLAWSYLKGRHDKNAKIIAKRCKENFNLTHCQEFISANQTVGKDIDITTIISKPNTTTTELPFNLNSTSSNQTIVDTANEKNTDTDLANPGLTLGAAAAHGLGSGMLNGLIHYFADRYSRNNKQASKTKIIAIYSSLFVHAAFAATFPLMLYKIQEHIDQGNEEEAQRLWDNLLLQAPLTFISTAGLSLGLHVVYEYTQLLFNRFRIIAQNTLPLAGTAVGLFKNPVATGVQMAASIIASSTTYGVFNWISPVKNNAIVLDVEAHENKGVELKLLNTENDVKPTANVIVGSEIIENTYLYITKEKLDDIRNQSEGIIILLEELVCSLEKSIEKDKSKIDSDTNPAVADTYQTIIDDKAQILQIIKGEVKNCNTEISFLNDDHKEAYKSYIIKNTHNPEEKKKIKDDYSSAMNKLGNVFKRMEPMFNNMKINLGTAHGYVKGASKSFAGDETLLSLDKLMDKIQFPLSLTKNYISKYNTWDAAEKGEKNGAIKALANKENFEKSIQPNTSQITSRPKKTRSFLNTRPQSVASDSRTHSSGSEEGSVISNGSSKDEENALIVRPLLKSSR